MDPVITEDSMKKNMGNIDRILRLILGPIIFLIAVLVIHSTVWTVILAAIGIIFLLTAFVGFCPGYVPVGLNTSKVKKQDG